MATFGKTDIGASSGTEWIEYTQIGSKFQAPSDGTVTQIDARTWATTAGKTWYATIYSDNSGVPQTLLGTSDGVVVGTGESWVTFTGLSVSITSGTYYWLCVCFPDAGGTNYRYDAGAANQFVYGEDYNGEPPPNNPWSGSEDYRAREMSIYATYTAAAGVTNKPGNIVTQAMHSILAKPQFPRLQPRVMP